MSKKVVLFKNMTTPRQQAETARLRVIGGVDSGAVFVLKDSVVFLGRGEENDVILNDLKISRKHLEITVHSGFAMVKDLGTPNGFLVNGLPYKHIQVKSGDKLGVGATVIELLISSSEETRFLTAHPNQTSPFVGAGSSGLTQFIQKPSSEHLSNGPQKSELHSFYEKNKNGILILIALMAMAVLLPEVEQKQKAKRNKYLDPKDLEAARLSGLALPVVDSSVVKSADAYFKEGFRELRSKNYIRAQVAFETALQVYNDHTLARIYLETTKKAMEDEAKQLLKNAKRDEEANRFSSAKVRYESVKRMYIRDQSNPLYKEADRRYEDVVKRMIEIERLQ